MTCHRLLHNPTYYHSKWTTIVVRSSDMLGDFSYTITELIGNGLTREYDKGEDAKNKTIRKAKATNGGNNKNEKPTFSFRNAITSIDFQESEAKY